MAGGAMPALRATYLEALGLEPLVLRGAAVSDDVAGAAATRTSDPQTAVDAHAAARGAVDPVRASHADARGAGRLPVETLAGDGLFAPRAARVCLLVANGKGFSGPHETLLRAVVQALGVSVAEASFDPRDGVPAIAFGVPGAQAALHAPALPDLRDAGAKRAAWPALRRLRRTLRSGA